jgi:tryptophanyl-tRNA synthetase
MGRIEPTGAEVFVVVADYRVLTDRDTVEHLYDYVTRMVLGYLAIGIDPARSVIFAHSTAKDEIAHSRQAPVSGLMFSYPVRQAANILFREANLVPVGQGQLPHVELTRRFARNAVKVRYSLAFS